MYGSRRRVKKTSKQQLVSTTGVRNDSCESVKSVTQSVKRTKSTFAQEKSVVKALTFEERDYLEEEEQTNDAAKSEKRRSNFEIASNPYLSFPSSKRQCLTGTVKDELSRINDRLGSMETDINHVRESVDRMAYFLKNSHLRFYFPGTK